ncbi:MAG: hypothetical protein INR71_13160, partial [Terriglobus roseus]|nr:hypothetical protein [Terriglobus roseus]
MPCRGYGKKPMNIRFKAQSERRKSRNNSPTEGPSRVPSSQIQPSENEEALAINFFTSSFALNGRSLDSSRGFFESVVPILSAELPTSTVSVAVSAVATFFLSRWRRGTSTLELSRVRLGQALRQLQIDLLNPAVRSRDATLLSILMLQCYENTRAVVQRDRAARVHQDGAITLIKSLRLDAFRSEHAQRLLLYVLNVETFSALRGNRPVDQDLAAWIESLADPSLNCSARLDKLGVRISSVQDRLALIQAADAHDPDAHGALEDLGTQLRSIEVALVTW